MGIFNPLGGECLYNIMKQTINYDAKHPGELFKTRPGIKMTYTGDTPETKKSSQCGWESHRDVLGTKGHKSDLNSYRKLMDTVVYMGYTPGLTYQSMPYVTQHNFETNSFKDDFLPTLKRMKIMIGKKVVVAGHSMGNIQVYSNLLKIDHKTKDSLIQHYSALFPSMIGDQYSLKMAFGAHLNEALPLSLSLKKWLSWIGMHSFIYGYWPLDPFQNHKEERYMKQIQQHVAHEENPSQVPKGFEWLPSATQNCYKNIQYGPQCSLGLEDSTKNPPMMTIAGKVISF